MIFKYKDEYFNIIQIASAEKTPDGKLRITMSNGMTHLVGQPEAQKLTDMLDALSAIDILDGMGGGSTGYMP